jgi:3-oxoacyl-[acyl-carrier protein] reductase
VDGLSGRTALITGAGQNVGAQVARVLAARGATVGVNDVFPDRAERVVEEIRVAGGKAEPVVADVTDMTAVTETFGQFGPIDILVNNAGIPISGISMNKFVDDDPAGWKALVDLNVYGPLNCTYVALPGMLDRGWGRVITISSEAARVGDKLIATYAAAKGAGPALMRSLAKEVGRQGVTCNSLSLASQANAGADENSDMALKRLRAYAIPRLGQASDVAAAVAWLVSEDASWVTGQTIPVNGGYATS